MKRRDFLRTAGGTAAAAAATAQSVAAQEDGGGTTTGGGSGGTTASGGSQGTAGGGNQSAGGGNQSASGGGGGGGPPKTVKVGPGGSLVFEPDDLKIKPGTTVNFVWESDGHNVVPNSIPEGATWEGSGPKTKLFDTGYTYSHTFTTLGEYDYHCAPHETAGMVGSITVTENPASGEKDLEELGVPIQAHWVGASTILAIIVTLVYTFYILKYGESANTGNTGGGE